MSTESTTLALPSDVLAAVDRLVQEGRALRRELAEVRRSTLDAEFRHMANDVEYQAEVRQILTEFAKADAETFCSDLQ